MFMYTSVRLESRIDDYIIRMKISKLQENFAVAAPRKFPTKIFCVWLGPGEMLYTSIIN